MDYWITVGFATLLIVAAVVMIVQHVRTWHQALGDESADDRERRFRRSQFRRRLQISGLLGMLGMGIVGGHFLRSPPLAAWKIAVYWGLMLVLALWLILLAMIDAMVTRFYFGSAQQKNFSEQSRLRVQLRRIQEEHRSGGNGSHQNDDPDD
jgi:hypothetical protein